MSSSDQAAETVSEAFDRYDDHLKLDRAERNAARDTHNRIRDVLRAAGLIVDAFLQGSFARKTMLAPLRDIDMIVILADSLESLRNDPAGPAKAMQLLIDALRVEFPDATFEPGRHAVKIDFEDGRFTFDCVPAFEVGNAARDVLIANTDDGTWDRSNTRQLIQVVQDRNQGCDGRWVHHARMCKDFVSKALASLPDKLPGLVSESICYHAVTAPTSHPEAMAAVLRAGARMLPGPISDLTGFDVLTDKIPDHILDAALWAFASAAEKADQALALAAAGDEPAAVDLWHAIFGEGFPPAPQPSIDETITGLMSGGMTATGRTTTQRTAVQPARPTRAWRSI